MCYGLPAELCKKKAPFQRLVLSKEQALDMFQANPFKVRM
jgi:threonyl-tRNA synthetase